ncbi:MAG: hypothetical protein KA419_09340 [Acidobacteria bacterium]|nr:hypothetical protein [Acidobacteriota bacterium]
MVRRSVFRVSAVGVCLLLAVLAATPCPAQKKAATAPPKPAPAAQKATPAAAPEKIVPCPPDFVLEKELPGEDPFWVYRPTFSPDGLTAAGFLHSSHKILIWDLKTAKVIKEYDESVHGMPALDGFEYTADGKMLILIYRDLPLKFLDLAAGKVVRTLPTAADPKKVYDYAFSPDMKLLAFGTTTGIKLWDLEKGAQIATYLDGKTVSGLDIVYYKTKEGKLVRLMAYGLFLGKGAEFRDVAGIIDLDTGAVKPVLNDVPKEKVKLGDMTLFWVSFEHGGGYLMVGYSVFPPQVTAGVYLVGTATGKYLADHALEQYILMYDACYLWKPFYGYLVCTRNMKVDPYKVSTEFLVITKTDGLTAIDCTREDKLAVQSVTVARDQSRALIATKASQAAPSKVYLYRLVPKTPK